MKYDAKGYPVPDEINPSSSVCITVPVPNDPTHLDNFYGALFTLTRWYNYRENPAKTGKATADVWREIFVNLEQGDCTLPTIYRMDTCGIIEFSIDGGENWGTLADFSNCFLWRLPDSQARNTVQSTANHAPMTFKRHAAQTAHMTQWVTEGDAPYAWIDNNFALRFAGVFGSALHGFYGGNFVGFNAEHTPGNVIQKKVSGSPAYGIHCVPQSNNWMSFYGAHPSGALVEMLRLSANTTQENSVSTLFGILRTNTPTSQATVALRSRSNVAPTSSNELRSGQTAALHYNYDNLLNLLSGVDKYGFYFNRLSSGKPSQTDAQVGSVAIDITGQKLWFKLSDDWYTPQDTTGVTSVVINPVDCDVAPSAVIVGNELTISLPDVSCPVEPEPTRFYHKEASRPSPGTTVSYEFLLQANEFVVLPWQLENGDQLITTILDGWWNDELFDIGADNPATVGNEGDGRVMFSGSPGTYDTNALDPSPSEPHMSVLTAYHSLVAPTFRHISANGTLEIESIDSTAKYAYIQPNTQSVYRAGAIHLRVYLTTREEISLCDTFNFSSNDQSWHAVGDNGETGGLGTASGIYEPSADCFESTYVSGSNKILIKPDQIAQFDGYYRIEAYITCRRLFTSITYISCAWLYKIDGVWAIGAGQQMSPTPDGEWEEVFGGYFNVQAGHTLEDVALFFDVNQFTETDVMQIQEIRIACRTDI